MCTNGLGGGGGGAGLCANSVGGGGGGCGGLAKATPLNINVLQPAKIYPQLQGPQPERCAQAPHPAG